MKIVIWMNMPSHHQSAFFQSLREHDGIDLLVRYYGRVTSERLQMGWQQPKSLPEGEMTVMPKLQALETVPDWRQRIHIIEGRESFRRELTRRFCAARVPWVHWGERGARRWTIVFRYPFWCWYGRQVAKYALGALAIGSLASKDFLRWGIPARKIAFLPYSVAPLRADVDPDDRIERFAAGRKIFLYCGELARHKGIDVLLRAFASLQDDGWVLVLVGPDRSGGKYLALAKRLGIERKILFRGTLSSERIATAMIQANVLVLPSRYDGWGVVLNEAASLGKALIGTTACGAAHHLIQPGINGYRIASNDPQALAIAMTS
ncbi:MAG: glycosyltransferase family 4 protein, partial [Gammaproteobacteria bacterium]